MDSMLHRQNKLILKLREECKRQAVQLDKITKKYRSVMIVLVCFFDNLFVCFCGCFCSLGGVFSAFSLYFTRFCLRISLSSGTHYCFVNAHESVLAYVT